MRLLLLAALTVSACHAQPTALESEPVSPSMAETAASWRALEVERFTAPPEEGDDLLLAGLKTATRGDLEAASDLLRDALEAAPDSLRKWIRTVAADVAEERFAWGEAVALRLEDDPSAAASIAAGYARFPRPSLALEGETSVPFDGLSAPVFVNGVEVDAVVDTGAPGTGIPRGLVERLGLRVDTTARGISRVPSMNLEFEVFAVLIDSVQVGSATFYNVPATVGWTEEDPDDEGTFFLGANVLRLADALRYDYTDSTFTVVRGVPDLEGDPNFVIDGGSAPVVSVMVGGQPSNAIVDTGNQRSVYLARGAFNLEDAPVLRSLSGDGWSVDFREVTFQVPGHAPFLDEAYEADFLFQAGNPIEVILGRTVWDDGALTVDVRNRQVRYEPSALEVGARAPRRTLDIPATAYVDVTVVALDSARAVPGQSVVVEGDRIVAVGPTATVQVPAGARVVDGRGRFLMPGLADMHAHLAMPGTEYFPMDNRATFALMLAHGVTQIRNLWGTTGLLALRDSVEAGQVLGPRIWTTGPFVIARPDTLNEPWSPSELGMDDEYLLAGTEADGRAAARYHVEAGYDFVKVHNLTSAAAYRGLVLEAERLGLPVVGHAPWAVGLASVLTGGRQNSLEHYDTFAGLAQASEAPSRTASEWYDRVFGPYRSIEPERLALLAELAAASRVWFVLTVIVSEWYSGPQPKMIAHLDNPLLARYTSLAQRASWREYAEGWATNYATWGVDMSLERPFALSLVRALHDAGARLLIGSDAPATMVPPGIGVHDEMALWAEAGIPALDVLRAATTRPARYLQEVGLADGPSGLEVGAPADLVLLRCDPLLDVANARDIEAVMTRGRLLDRADLDRMLADVEARYAESP